MGKSQSVARVRSLSLPRTSRSLSFPRAQCVGALIILNCIAMGIETDYRPENADGIQVGWYLVDNFFTIVPAHFFWFAHMWNFYAKFRVD